MEIYSAEYACAIQEINEQLSKLEMAHKVKGLDPKIEKAVQYYRTEREKVISNCDKNVKALDTKIEQYTAKIEREKKELDEKLAMYIEKIENQIKEEKEQLEKKTKYYDDNIQQREGPIDDPVYEMKKTELIKQRDYNLLRLNECKQNELYFSKSKQQEKEAKERQASRTYYFQETDKYYDSYQLLQAAMDRYVYERHGLANKEEEMKKELEERRKEDELYENRMKELEKLQKECNITELSDISENDL